MGKRNTKRHGPTVAAEPPAPRTSLVALSILVAMSGACGYSLVGTSSTLPPEIKVIYFQTLTNQTQQVGVEQRLSGEIARELASRGRFQVKPEPDGANAQLDGAVTGFSLYPVAFDPTGRAREYQVRITARVSLKTLPDGKALWENPSFTFQDNYAFSSSAASYVDLENEAIDRVAARFAESLVSSILEGF